MVCKLLRVVLNSLFKNSSLWFEFEKPLFKNLEHKIKFFLLFLILLPISFSTEELLPYNYEHFLLSNNPATIANQLYQLIKNKDKCIKIINNQKNFILSNYSSKASVNAFIEILK